MNFIMVDFFIIFSSVDKLPIFVNCLISGWIWIENRHFPKIINSTWFNRNAFNWWNKRNDGGGNNVSLRSCAQLSIKYESIPRTCTVRRSIFFWLIILSYTKYWNLSDLHQDKLYLSWDTTSILCSFQWGSCIWARTWLKNGIIERIGRWWATLANSATSSEFSDNLKFILEWQVSLTLTWIFNLQRFKVSDLLQGEEIYRNQMKARNFLTATFHDSENKTKLWALMMIKRRFPLVNLNFEKKNNTIFMSMFYNFYDKFPIRLNPSSRSN